MAPDRDEKLQGIVKEIDGLLAHLKDTVGQMSELLRQDLDGKKTHDGTN